MTSSWWHPEIRHLEVHPGVTKCRIKVKSRTNLWNNTTHSKKISIHKRILIKIQIFAARRRGKNWKNERKERTRRSCWLCHTKLFFFRQRLLRKTTSNSLILSSFAASFYNLFSFIIWQDNQSKFVIWVPGTCVNLFSFQW